MIGAIVVCYALDGVQDLAIRWLCREEMAEKRNNVLTSGKETMVWLLGDAFFFDAGRRITLRHTLSAHDNL